MTQQAQHTPGPWTANKARTLIHISGESPVCEISVSANHIHEDFPGCKQQYIQRQKANARLISTAPKLLEALEEVINKITILGEIGNVCVEDTLMELNELVAKARGAS